MLCSKFKEMESFLGYCFSHKCIKKRYRALCPGTIEPHIGVINASVDGKESSTRYQVVQVTPSNRFGTISTVDLWPLQGRKHQLRVHLKSVGHAILGDPKYSPYINVTSNDNEMCLWALGVEYPDPELHVYVTPPNTSIGVCHDRIDDHTEGIHNEKQADTEVEEAACMKTLQNVNGDEKKNSLFDSKGGKSRKYDVETLQQNKYISIEIPEPKFFEFIRSTV